MSDHQIILLGGPNSGKTHYSGQLFGRVSRRPGALRLRDVSGIPSDITTLEEVLHCLAQGCVAPHTPTDMWGEIKFPLTSEQGKSFELVWPDYGGEQIKQIFDSREVTKKWADLLKSANGWIFLIRIGIESVYDGTNFPQNDDLPIPPGNKRAERWDANAYWVELIQILLHVSNIGCVNKISTPKVAILLSCYDELPEEKIGKTPKETLRVYLPLLHSFIFSNMHENCATVWGLSSLGCSLTEEGNSDAFIDEGPETQGWVVNPTGEKSDDLSAPIAWLIENL